MKRFTAGLCSVLIIAVVMSLSFASIVYADGDEPEKTTRTDQPNVEVHTETPLFGTNNSSLKLDYDRIQPKDGSNNLQMQNVGVKLYFDGDVSAKALQENNKECFTFTDAKGRKIPSKAYFDEKGDSGYILVTVTPKLTDKNKSQMLVNKTKYKLIISGGLASADGRTLGDDVTLNYRTIDQSGSSKIYMLLMLLMVAGMLGMTFFQNKRKAKAEAEVAAREGKVNPYKLAKEKKISVQEALEIIERDKKRRDKRLQKAGISPDGKPAQLPEVKRNTKRISKPRPISEAGSTYKTGRKAIAEKKAKENAERRAKAQAKAKPKAQSGSHNSNKKKSGKGKKK